MRVTVYKLREKVKEDLLDCDLNHPDTIFEEKESRELEQEAFLTIVSEFCQIEKVQSNQLAKEIERALPGLL